MNKLLKIFLLTCSLETLIAMDADGRQGEASTDDRTPVYQTPQEAQPMTVIGVTLGELQSLHSCLSILGANKEVDLDLFPQVIGYLQEFTISKERSPLFRAIGNIVDLERQIRILVNFSTNNQLILKELDLKYSGRNYENEILKFIIDSLKALERLR